MARDPRKQIRDRVEQLEEEIEQRLDSWTTIDSPKAFREMELEIASLSRKLQDGITGAILKHRLYAADFQARTSSAARSGGGYRSGGCRAVNVHLLGGGSVDVRVDYLKRKSRVRHGRKKRRTGKRGKGGSGLYPALVALGVAFGASPALIGEVTCQIADSDSFRTGLAALARRGIDLGHKPTLRLVNHMSHRTNSLRHEWLTRVRGPESSILVDKRVVVATDGGRLRERRKTQKSRCQDGSYRHGFDAPWREPKMLVIYTIDAQGNPENEFRPIYDGTLGDCDAVFQMLGAYLEALGASAAKELIFVGDGAEWIWNRTDGIRERLGLAPDQVTEIIDWYHAVEALHEIAAIPASWSSARKQRWLRRAKDLLFIGDTEYLIHHINELAKGRRTKAVRKHLGYFRNNRHRMQYSSFEEALVPLGSGAVESMIRRVVNLRLKGNAKFWLQKNADGMLLLRSYLKAGRFDDLIDWSLTTTTSWWPPAADTVPASPITS